MKSTSELRSMLDRLALALPEPIRADLSIEYGHCSTIHGVIDVVIRRGEQCMALGRFRPVSEHEASQFADRFRMAMGYPDDTWYLFDFDGEQLLINDLSLDNPQDDLTDALESGLRRLCTVPAQWREEQETMEDMKRFLEAMRDLINEDAINNPVK